MMKRSKAVFRIALKDSLPILMGYGTMGFAAGVVFAACSGVKCPALWSAAVALTSFSGTLHFAIGYWLRDNASIAFIALATFAISFRYALYGFSLASKWRDIGAVKKFFLVLGLTDENYALEASRRFAVKADFVCYCLWLTALNLCYWTAGCTLGALLGNTFKLPDRGMDFVMAALFLAILTDQIRAIAKGRAKQ